MGKLQPTYTKEFKQQAVQLFKTSGKSKTQIARDLGISDSALSKWCKEFGERGEGAFPGKGHQAAEEEEQGKGGHRMKISRLKAERKLRGWSQAYLAEALGVSTKTVIRWEQGFVVPFPYYRKKLSALFDKTPEELGLLTDADESNAMQEVPSVTSAILAQVSLLANSPVLSDEELSLLSYTDENDVVQEVQSPITQSTALAVSFSSKILLILIVTASILLTLILQPVLSNILVGSPSTGSTHVKENYSPPSYTLTILNNNPLLQNSAQHLQKAFNAVYPQLVNRFALDPKKAAKNFILKFSSVLPSNNLKGRLSSPISVSGTSIIVNSHWIEQNPNDIGRLTYVLTLSLEMYPSGSPSWFADGMATYARTVYGPADDDWSLPNSVQPQDKYTQGGGIAAQFLLWLEQHTTLNIVDQLNHTLQRKQSFSVVFQHLTHHSIDDLWSQYQKDPDITLTPEQLYKTVTNRKPLYQSSSLRVQVSQPGMWEQSANLGGLSMSNFAVQADITILSGDGGGFVFRYDTNEQYRFRIGANGTFDLVNQTGGGIKGFSPVIKEGFNKTNRVTIIVQKHTIYVYVNDQLIIEVDGSSTYVNGQPSNNMNGGSSNYGTVAGMAVDFGNSTNVQFENVQVF